MKRLIILTGLLATTIIASAQTEVVTGVMRGKDYGVTYLYPRRIQQVCRSLSSFE